MTSNARTAASFAKYRAAHPPEQPINPEARRYAGDCDPMETGDGLEQWVDGPVEAPQPEPAERPELATPQSGTRLWVVTGEDVLHGPEQCDFGAKREAGVTKHSNLTGGGTAHVGGEVIFLDRATIALTGSSGRYRLRSAAEMSDIESAFLGSGYNVWSMGYNEDTNRPNLFEGMTDLEWVSR